MNALFVEDFLSFRRFEWPVLDHHLNLIVGPNGAGKTNLFHAVRALLAAVSGQDRTVWQTRAHGGSGDRPFRIAIDVMLTSSWEKELVLRFVQAAICDMEGIRGAVGGAQPANQAELSAQIAAQNDPAALEFLHAGRLIAQYHGAGYWECWYEIGTGPVPLRWYLFGGTPQGLGEGAAPGGPTSLFVAWWNSLDEDGRQRLATFLMGQRPDLDLTPDFKELESWLRAPTKLAVALWVRQQSVAMPTHLRFAALSGFQLGSAGTYGVIELFTQILRRAIVFTDNVRRPPATWFRLDETPEGGVDLADGGQLPLHLLLLKNGAEQDQAIYVAVQGAFERLTGQGFDVQMHLPAQRVREAQTALEVQVSSDWGNMPLELSGAGRAEALFLSALLASSADRLVLLDEPAANLHPTVQATFIREVLGCAGQFMVTTHSPLLMPAVALPNTSRLFLKEGATARAALASNSDPGALARLEKILRASVDARGMLFARAVLLVEGETELGALPVWHERHLGRSLESASVVVYDVGGGESFEAPVRFLQQFGVAWAIVCDGPAVGQPGRRNIMHQLERAGADDLTQWEALPFAERRTKLAGRGVFTLANSEGDEFEVLPVIRAHDAEAAREVGASKVRKARYIAESYDCPPEVAQLLRDVSAYLDV